MKAINKIKLNGPDLNIEISLKEYGLAWHEEDNQIIFIYGIQREGGDFTRFDKCEIDKDICMKEHFNWIDGDSWNEIDCSCLESAIQDILWLYGTENTFGSIYFEGYTFEELREKYEI